MKKILLFLLHPEKSFEWFGKHRIEIKEEKEGYFAPYSIGLFLENKPAWLSRSEEFSYRRTFRILGKLGLVEFDKVLAVDIS